MADERRAGKAGVIVVLLALVAGGVLYCCPQLLRAGGRVQPPVGASVRGSLVGFGRVLQLRNDGDVPLTGVVVEAANAARNTHASYRIDRIERGDVKELGWREWGWSVDPGETFRVSADGYALSITFSSAQLGVH